MWKDSDNDQAKSPSAKATDVATIGPSITIKGEITGSEDLVVLGQVEGTVNLRQNTVTVGKGARVTADIFGNLIHVEGEVVGDLTGSEQIVVHSSGYVRGNIVAPRLTLQDGARLKGSIDTEASSTGDRAPSKIIDKIRLTTPATDGAAAAKPQTPQVDAAKKNGVTPSVQ